MSPPLPTGYLSFKKIDYLQLILDGKKLRYNTGRGPFEDIAPESIKNMRIMKSDDHGNPSVIESDCRIDWDDGHPPPCEALVLRMSQYGYPMCLGIKNKKLDDASDPACMRSMMVTDEMTAKYQSGGYSR